MATTFYPTQIKLQLTPCNRLVLHSGTFKTISAVLENTKDRYCCRKKPLRYHILRTLHFGLTKECPFYIFPALHFVYVYYCSRAFYMYLPISHSLILLQPLL